MGTTPPSAPAPSPLTRLLVPVPTPLRLHQPPSPITFPVSLRSTSRTFAFLPIFSSLEPPTLLVSTPLSPLTPMVTKLKSPSTSSRSSPVPQVDGLASASSTTAPSTCRTTPTALFASSLVSTALPDRDPVISELDISLKLLEPPGSHLPMRPPSPPPPESSPEASTASPRTPPSPPHTCSPRATTPPPSGTSLNMPRPTTESPVMARTTTSAPTACRDPAPRPTFQPPRAVQNSLEPSPSPPASLHSVPPSLSLCDISSFYGQTKPKSRLCS